MPMDYHVWNTMLEHYERHMAKLANIIPSLKAILWTIQNDLLHEFIAKKIVSFFQQISIVCCCNLWALTL